MIIIFMQLLLPAAQIGCLAYALIKKQNVIDVCSGFAIWGGIPNILIAWVSNL